MRCSCSNGILYIALDMNMNMTMNAHSYSFCNLFSSGLEKSDCPTTSQATSKPTAETQTHQQHSATQILPCSHGNPTLIVVIIVISQGTFLLFLCFGSCQIVPESRWKLRHGAANVSACGILRIGIFGGEPCFGFGVDGSFGS
jgi:hypothetical protein